MAKSQRRRDVEEQDAVAECPLALWKDEEAHHHEGPHVALILAEAEVLRGDEELEELGRGKGVPCAAKVTEEEDRGGARERSAGGEDRAPHPRGEDAGCGTVGEHRPAEGLGAGLQHLRRAGMDRPGDAEQLGGTRGHPVRTQRPVREARRDAPPSALASAAHSAAQLPVLNVGRTPHRAGPTAPPPAGSRASPGCFHPSRPCPDW